MMKGLKTGQQITKKICLSKKQLLISHSLEDQPGIYFYNSFSIIIPFFLCEPLGILCGSLCNNYNTEILKEFASTSK